MLTSRQTEVLIKLIKREITVEQNELKVAEGHSDRQAVKNELATLRGLLIGLNMTDSLPQQEAVPAKPGPKPEARWCARCEQYYQDAKCCCVIQPGSPIKPPPSPKPIDEQETPVDIEKIRQEVWLRAYYTALKVEPRINHESVANRCLHAFDRKFGKEQHED